VAEESKGGLVAGALAVVAIGVVGYVIYGAMQSGSPSTPQINMSREEIMKAAMVDGPGTSPETKKADPKTAPLKKDKSKGGPTP